MVSLMECMESEGIPRSTVLMPTLGEMIGLIGCIPLVLVGLDHGALVVNVAPELTPTQVYTQAQADAIPLASQPCLVGASQTIPDLDTQYYGDACGYSLQHVWPGCICNWNPH